MRRLINCFMVLMLACSLAGCSGESAAAAKDAFNAASDVYEEAKKAVEDSGIIEKSEEVMEQAKQSIEDSGIVETSREILEEAKDKAAGVLPEELSSLMDPSSFLNLIDEDNFETISAMGYSIGVLASLSTADSYEEIYDDYAARIRKEGPKLLEEYRKEAADNLGGMEGLAEIANEKVQQLADLNAKGTQAMAVYMYAKDPEGYENYEAWAKKLYEVYSEEGEKIYSAYLSTFGG
ncbi:MAG: hypothetical protein IKE16_01965 [Solobacterium sp.]|nr:hypothetical protein [Solobacterium sp.]